MKKGIKPGLSGNKAMKIGIVGTGMLGNAVGLHLLDSGFDVTAYNRTEKKTRELEAKGARIVDSPKKVAKESALVITIVKDADAVNKVSFGEHGIVEGRHDSMAVADMSTVSPFESKDTSEKFARFGIKKLDVPVMGGPNVAVSGKLVVMGSGDRDTFDRFKKVFETIGDRVFYLGGHGMAHSVKLSMNLQIALLALSLSEGLVLAEKTGVNPETFLKVLNSTYFKTGMSQNKAYKMIQEECEPTFTLKNLKKDITTIAHTADMLGIKLPIIKKAEEIYQKAEEDGFGESDYTGVIGYIRKINKTES